MKRGRFVDRLFSCDGVYHNCFMPWRAMWGPVSDRILGEPVIEMPRNVKKIDMWRQKMDYPRGHEIAGGAEEVALFNGKFATDHGFLMRNHCNIDEAPEIHKAIYECVKNYARAI